jgi:hypothetical protein
MSGMQSAARRQLFICYFLRGMKRRAAISVVATLFINHGPRHLALDFGMDRNLRHLLFFTATELPLRSSRPTSSPHRAWRAASAIRHAC